MINHRTSLTLTVHLVPNPLGHLSAPIVLQHLILYPRFQISRSQPLMTAVLQTRLAQIGFFGLPALGTRTLSLVAGQAGARRAREIKAKKTTNQKKEGEVRASLGVVAGAELG